MTRTCIANMRPDQPGDKRGDHFWPRITKDIHLDEVAKHRGADYYSCRDQPSPKPCVTTNFALGPTVPRSLRELPLSRASALARTVRPACQSTRCRARDTARWRGPDVSTVLTSGHGSAVAAISRATSVASDGSSPRRRPRAAIRRSAVDSESSQRSSTSSLAVAGTGGLFAHVVGSEHDHTEVIAEASCEGRLPRSWRAADEHEANSGTSQEREHEAVQGAGRVGSTSAARRVGEASDLSPNVCSRPAVVVRETARKHQRRSARDRHQAIDNLASGHRPIPIISMMRRRVATVSGLP